MRLFLSSQGLGTAPEAFVALLRGRTRIGVIPNGVYLDDPAKRRLRIDSDVAELQALGLDPRELDLNDHSGTSELAVCDAVWVLGGDVVELRTAFASSGADDVIRTRLAEDSLVYAGYSAGACLLGPAFPGPDGLLVSGLHVVPFTIAPHVRHGSNGLTEWFSRHDLPFIALRDGEAIVIDADTQRLVGQHASSEPD